MTPRRKVAVTGLGLVTPVGNNAPTAWANLVAGRTGIGPIRQFDARGFPVRIGAEVKDFTLDPAACDPKLLKFASRSHQFALAAASEALAAASEALADAGIRPQTFNNHRWGLSVGAGMLGVTFDELQAVHAAAAPGGDFDPDALLDISFPADPVAFCRKRLRARRRRRVPGPRKLGVGPGARRAHLC